ncbi:glycosyltransferase [Acidianus manzaensis]|uniref:Glycosyl transferase family 1 domain-containing protein n=1 Tax=Acidianus manzaensis TaxID=282676 RepID=A0A1W6JWN0_9CREN|nr:glycosyltransferase [Acidianus manzaensis]ARM74640.1 hypothetical protein B6F84_00440 [Acidianus manzaensis]
MKNILIIMPPINLTSESTFALSFLKVLEETKIKPYLVFPKNTNINFPNAEILHLNLIMGPIISPVLDLPIIKLRSLLKGKNIKIVNLYYSHLHLGGDLNYIIYPPGILRKDRQKPYKNIKKIYFKLSYPIILKLAEGKINLCSSKYVKEIMKDKVGFDCEIVYPPVIPQETKNQEKQNLIVGVGKYVPSKHWEEFIQIAKKVKQKQPNTKFKIIGGLELVHNSPKDYFSELRKLAGDDVELLTDVSEYDKWRILNSAKIVLHCMRYDNFGLGVAEAMHAGAVPIVYKSSGTWMDIIEEGKYGIGYTSVEEASQEIIKIIEDEKTFKEYSEKAQQKAQQYNIQNFKNKIHNIINQLQ